MALHVCENINEDLFVIINKLFSTKYPIDIFDLTSWSKLIILLPCFQRFSLFNKVYLKSKLWVVKLLQLNIETRSNWNIMIWLSDTKCCHLTIHYVLPKCLPGPNLHYRFMKNRIYTSLLGSLLFTQWIIKKNVAPAITILEDFFNKFQLISDNDKSFVALLIILVGKK